MVHLASMMSLRSIRLADCNAITNMGIALLSSLTNLEKLAFLRCTRISEAGMHFLSKLPSLDSLTVYSCNKVPTPFLIPFAHPMETWAAVTRAN